MRTIDFKFDVDDDVITPFGDHGIVSMLGHDESGNLYYVKTSKGGEWFKEKQLTAKEA